MPGITRILLQPLRRVGQGNNQWCDIPAVDQVVEHRQEARVAHKIVSVMNNEKGMRTRMIETGWLIDVDESGLTKGITVNFENLGVAARYSGLVLGPIRCLVARSMADGIGSERIMGLEGVERVSKQSTLAALVHFQFVFDPRKLG